MYRRRYGSGGRFLLLFRVCFILQHGGGIFRFFAFARFLAFPLLLNIGFNHRLFYGLDHALHLTDIVQINTCRWLGCRLWFGWLWFVCNLLPESLASSPCGCSIVVGG